MLLAWHRAPKVAGAKKTDKLIQWQNIVAGEEAPPLFASWTNDDEQRPLGVLSEKIDLSDTHSAREAALKEIELGAAVDRIEKRSEMGWKLDQCDEGLTSICDCVHRQRHKRSIDIQFS